MELFDTFNLLEEYDEQGNWSPDDLEVDIDFFEYFDKASARIEQLTRAIRERRSQWKNKPTEWTAATREKFQARLRALEAQRDKYRHRLDQKVGKYERLYSKDRHVRVWRDKISWVTGVGNCVLSPLIAVLLPEWIPLAYTAQTIFLMTARVIIFRRLNWHYFLWDMCYFVNLLTLIFLFVLPDSKFLFLAIYGLTHGPMMWAIAVWRNSLVFHSMDRVTSVFIHLYPPFVLYTIRYLLPFELQKIHYPAVAALSQTEQLPTFAYSMKASLVTYLVWQALYYTFIMHRRRLKVEKEGRITSYSWLLSPSKLSKPSRIQRICNIFGERYNKLMFMLLQLCFTAIVSAPTVIYLQSVRMNTAALAIFFTWSVWNGGSYYIDVFSRRYIMELDRLEEEARSKDSIDNGEEKMKEFKEDEHLIDSKNPMEKKEE